MNKRNEKSKLTKPELIDVVKIIDWTVDVSPVELCQAINRAGNYKAQHKYHAGEKKFYDLVNGYDAKLLSSGVVLIKKQGKDKFYSLKPGVSKNTLLELLGGEPVVEEKKPEVTTMPTTGVVEIPVVAEEPKKKRIARELGDNESTLKAILVLKAISLSEKGIVLTETMTKLRKDIGWNRQRYINKKYMTIYQEAEEVVKSYFGVSIVVGKRSLSFSGDTKEIPKYISELTGLITSMSDHEKQIMEKINNLTPVPVPAPEKEEEKKVEVKGESKPIIVKKVVTEKKKDPTPSPKPDRPVKFLNPSTPIRPDEKSTDRWKKGLIAEWLEEYLKDQMLRREPISYNVIVQEIQKYRKVYISFNQLKMYISEINRDYNVFSYRMGGDCMKIVGTLERFYEDYSLTKMTESIYVRLHLDLTDFRKMFPDLNGKIISPITARDNIFQIKMNRTEQNELDVVRLLSGLRVGEIVLGGEDSWWIKRVTHLCPSLRYVLGISNEL